MAFHRDQFWLPSSLISTYTTFQQQSSESLYMLTIWRSCPLQTTRRRQRELLLKIWQDYFLIFRNGSSSLVQPKQYRQPSCFTARRHSVSLKSLSKSRLYLFVQKINLPRNKSEKSTHVSSTFAATLQELSNTP